MSAGRVIIVRMNEIIDIIFCYKGQDYSAIVSPTGGPNLSLIVQYMKEPSRQFERTIEIYQRADNTWMEKKEKISEIGADPEFVQIIGTAITNVEL